MAIEAIKEAFMTIYKKNIDSLSQQFAFFYNGGGFFG